MLAGHSVARPPTQKLPAGHRLADPLTHMWLVGHATHSHPLGRADGFVFLSSPALQMHLASMYVDPPGQTHWARLKEPAGEYRLTGHPPTWLPPVQ